MSRIRRPKPHPCTSCPYRRDVPSGVWTEEEYVKLPKFDGPLHTQPPSVFLCHQQDETLCSGWAGCHDMSDSLGLRFAELHELMTPGEIDATLDYVCPIPLFSSGAEAAEHGMAEIEAVGVEAVSMMEKLQARRERRAL